jgi:hypothetical protein
MTDFSVDFPSIDEGRQRRNDLAALVAVLAVEGLSLGQAVTVAFKFYVGISLAKVMPRFCLIDLKGQA